MFYFGKDFEVMSALVLLGKYFMGLSAFDYENILTRPVSLTFLAVALLKRLNIR